MNGGQLSNEAYRFKVTLGGGTHTQQKPGGLESLLIEDHVDLIGVARVTFNLEHASWSALQVGDDLVVEVGASQRKMFKGLVTGVRHLHKRGRDAVTVVAMDPLVKLTSSRRTEVYEEQTDSDIASQVLSRAGVTSGQVDSTQPARDHVMQRNESDLDFLKRLAARNDYLLMANEGKIEFSKPQLQGAPVEISQEVLEHLDYSYSAIRVPPSITCYGWDYVEAAKVEGSASSGDLDTIGGGKSAVDAAGAIWSDTSYVSDVHVASQGEAKDIAVGELNRLARNFLRGKATVDGNAAIHAGVRVKFVGHRTGFNPEVVVVSSRHLFEFRRGYTTEFTFCSNTLPT